ncbi:MAG: CehA/McbA family metallohydrolase [Dehalococcoidia bacterium]
MTSRLGTARVSQSRFPAGARVTLAVEFEVGGAGIARGGALRIQLPDSWHFGEALTAKPVHALDGSAPNYVSGTCSRSTAEVEVTVEGGTLKRGKANREGIDGRSGRFVFVARAEVKQGRLEPGDSVQVVFGDTSAGCEGFEASRWVDGPEQIAVAVDATGDGRFELLAQDMLPAISVHHSVPAELVVIAPSTVAVGEEHSLRVAVLDAHGNRCDAFGGDVHITSPDGINVPSGHRFEPHDRGVLEIPIRAEAEGVFRLGIRVDGLPASVSNPVLVSQDPRFRLYWGDIHSHAARSFDGIGRNPFEYAREVAALDFYALTDHCEGWSPGDWERLQDEVRKWCQEGTFATLLAYEATFPGPWGHHNVYLRGLDGPVLGSHNATLLDLWEALAHGEALTVPHHTGVRFAGAEGIVTGGGTPNPDWGYHDAELRRLIEIYSGHGQSEMYDPDHPLAYENTKFDHLATSSEGPHYAHDAWLMGHRLGVLASSDDHHAQPGRGELGHAAVWAEELTREGIFDGIFERRTYATTGARILLEMAVDGNPMGSFIEAPGREVSIEVKVHGTDLIERVDLLEGDETNGLVNVIHTWSPGTLDFEGQIAVSPVNRGFYYMRVRQQATYRGRVPMAWSSPVWISP